jgi:hypothetical protein
MKYANLNLFVVLYSKYETDLAEIRTFTWPLRQIFCQCQSVDV